MVIFLWILSQGLAKRNSVKFFAIHERRGKIEPRLLLRRFPAAVRYARQSSLRVIGAKVFNRLTLSLRNNQVHTFKSTLYAFNFSHVCKNQQSASSNSHDESS